MQAVEVIVTRHANYDRFCNQQMSSTEIYIDWFGWLDDSSAKGLLVASFTSQYSWNSILCKLDILETRVLPITGLTDTCAACNRPWWAAASLPLLTSSLWTKIGIIYTQLLQEEKIFPMMPRSEWLAEWSLRYAQKCSKSWAKNSDQNFLPLQLAAPW